jgi:hypothetical protein
MHDWILLLLLATGEVKALPATPSLCTEWALNVSLGHVPSVDVEGVKVPVVFALCSQGVPHANEIGPAKRTPRLRGRRD